MYIIIVVLSILIFIKTLSYGIFEIKTNSNTIAGITIIVIAVFSLIFPNVVLYINGIF